MIDSEAKKEILAYTIQATSDSLLIEENNAKLKEKIKKFENIISTTQIDLDLCREKLNEYNKKKLLIQKKREKLIEMQRRIIKILDNQTIISDMSDNPSDYIGIPPVLMFILETLYSATEKQLSLFKIKIPISQILDMSDSINEMYNKLVESNIINETDDESMKRNEGIAQNQQFFMNELLGTIKDSDVNNNGNEDLENNIDDDMNNNIENNSMSNNENIKK